MTYSAVLELLAKLNKFGSGGATRWTKSMSYHCSDPLVSDDSPVTNKPYGFNHGYQPTLWFQRWFHVVRTDLAHPGRSFHSFPWNTTSRVRIERCCKWCKASGAARCQTELSESVARFLGVPCFPFDPSKNAGLRCWASMVSFLTSKNHLCAGDLSCFASFSF